MPVKTEVVIVGAGPTGLTAALFLAEAGVNVRVLESRTSIYDDPRAATFHPPTLEMFEKCGITKKLHEMGILCPRWQFRGREEGVIAEFDLGILADITPYPYRLQCEQHKLVAAISELLSTHPKCSIHYGVTVEAVEQEAGGVSVRTADGDVHHASFVVGADGGRSVVRKSQDIAFHGFTYEERFLVITTGFDFEPLGFAYSCYVSDPREWCALFKVPGAGPPGVWRVVFATPPDKAAEQLLDHEDAKRKLHGLIPSAHPYPIVHTNLYTVHQRVAARYRRDRVLLAGDAAHVNNPLGGMGMNFGIHDAVDVAEKIARVLSGESSDRLLDVYDRQRRHVANAFLQAMTIQNKRVLEEKNSAVRRQRLQEMADIARDPEKSRAFLMRTAMFEGLRAAKQVH
jgi:3-(3-hydroxy-phenyl)propionate hydroxylase